MFYIGIDIGSTASKVCVFENDNIKDVFVLPTGWSSVKTAEEIKNKLKEIGADKKNSKIVATGYGRVSVPYADKTITEITCHGKGAYYLFKKDCTVIDIGGQDTKVITVEDGNVTNFTMNDKCAAGTGRFLELMANTLGFDIEEMCERAKNGENVTISSMCTVFAESEVISLIGSGKKREDIAHGVLDSITGKVKSLCQKHSDNGQYFLTGGLSENNYILERLSEKLGSEVKAHELGRYAGAIGAALMSQRLK
ncbi:acyl-CoA dehydratase activase [Clostridium sporogenes]|jgi:predicted CoA-substrate-specific enzyme activase|uniref:(R)-hydroxyglutaryl-CoA dehydratase activator n=2 Tax=Clostridium TaxID=1485 RepID=A0A7X5PDK4_CLOSG|nr:MULTISPECIES: acyl-CoA dehydratase activase [Clostridium]AJD32177.1 putative CoA-substrate-specific enzyme activase domain protein [Clostridium botulinum Prevot_594]AVP62056.1 CoA activase [Clostridium botulinum]AKC64058.1 (R)-hydroxyglutaryl-CoA dehydratase activator [Clostridium sporogenes]AKJ91195.1 CoA activase [Clostridium sporogenes]AVP65800.1 CoA activase [Clostridium botulinum]